MAMNKWESGPLHFFKRESESEVLERTTTNDTLREHESIIKLLRATFKSGKTKSYEWRISQLKALRKFCTENTEAIEIALYKDLKKPKVEANVEVAAFMSLVDCALLNLRDWMKDEHVSCGPLLAPGRTMIRKEPKGVVLSIKPWNFPVFLSLYGILYPMVAGNCVLLDPSECCPAVEELFYTQLPLYVDNDAIRVIKADGKQTQLLLSNHKFDHVFFTGGPGIARHITGNANIAKNLTPLTLELGGKGACVMTRSCLFSKKSSPHEKSIPTLLSHVKRAISGKLANNGQICIAVDYFVVHEDILEDFLVLVKQIVKEWYGADPQKSESYGRIIHKRGYDRLIEMRDDFQNVMKKSKFYDSSNESTTSKKNNQNKNRTSSESTKETENADGYLMVHSKRADAAALAKKFGADEEHGCISAFP